MLICVDGNNQKLLLENVNFSSPSFDVFVVFCNFQSHFLEIEVSVAVIIVVFFPEHISDKFLDKKGRVNEDFLVQFLRKHLGLEVLDIICNDSVVQISLGPKFIQVISSDRAGMALLSSFEGEFAFNVSCVVIFVGIIFFDLFFARRYFILLLFFMSFKKLVSSLGRNEVEFKIQNFIFGLFVYVRKRYLREKGGLFRRRFDGGLLI